MQSAETCNAEGVPPSNVQECSDLDLGVWTCLHGMPPLVRPADCVFGVAVPDDANLPTLPGSQLLVFVAWWFSARTFIYGSGVPVAVYCARK